VADRPARWPVTWRPSEATPAGAAPRRGSHLHGRPQGTQAPEADAGLPDRGGDGTGVSLDFGEGTPALRDRAVLELLYASGIRLAELIGLNRDDAVDLERGQVRVLGKGNRERIVPIGREAMRALAAYATATAADARADARDFPSSSGPADAASRGAPCSA
jgi:integrase/recombinase XerC